MLGPLQESSSRFTLCVRSCCLNRYCQCPLTVYPTSKASPECFPIVLINYNMQCSLEQTKLSATPHYFPFQTYLYNYTLNCIAFLRKRDKLSGISTYWQLFEMKEVPVKPLLFWGTKLCQNYANNNKYDIPTSFRLQESAQLICRGLWVPQHADCILVENTSQYSIKVMYDMAIHVKVFTMS